MADTCLEASEDSEEFDSPQDRKALHNRVARIKGQIGGIERMIEEGRYCIDLVHQIRSATRALEGLATKVMERHLETCVRDAMRSEDPYDEREKVEEFIEALKKFLK